MFDFLRKAAQGVGNFIYNSTPVGGAIKAVQRNPQLQQQARNIQRGVQQVQRQIPRQIPQPPPVPKINLPKINLTQANNILGSLGKFGAGFSQGFQQPVRQGFQNLKTIQPQNIAKQYQQFTPVDIGLSIVKPSHAFSPITKELERASFEAARRNPGAVNTYKKIYGIDLRNTNQNAAIKDAIPNVIGRGTRWIPKPVRGVTDFVGENIVRPTYNSASDLSRLHSQGASELGYTPDLRGGAKLGTDLFNVGSLAYSGTLAKQFAQAGLREAPKLALKLAPRLAATGTGTNLLNQVAQGKKLNELDLKEAALSGAAYTGLGLGIPVVGKGIGKGISKLLGKGVAKGVAKVDFNAPVTVKTLAEKGKLLQDGYTNVKVKFDAPTHAVDIKNNGIITELAPKGIKGVKIDKATQEAVDAGALSPQLAQQGYKVTPDLEIIAPNGKKLSIGEIQQLEQSSALTKAEQKIAQGQETYSEAEALTKQLGRQPARVADDFKQPRTSIGRFDRKPINPELDQLKQYQLEQMGVMQRAKPNSPEYRGAVQNYQVAQQRIDLLEQPRLGKVYADNAPRSHREPKKLQQVFDNKRLFEKYPQMKDIDFRFTSSKTGLRSGGAGGSYYPGGRGRIEIGKQGWDYTFDTKKISALEKQIKAIYAEAKSSGLSEAQMQKKYLPAITKLENEIYELQQPKNATGKQLNETGRSWLTHEIEHAKQDIKGIKSTGGNYADNNLEVAAREAQIKYGKNEPIYETVPKGTFDETKQLNLEQLTPSTKPLKLKGVSKTEEAKTMLLNRFEPIERFVRQKQVELGRKLKPSENPTYYIKEFLGGGGIANARIDNELTPIVRQTKRFDELRQYLIAQRTNELAERGISKGRADSALEQIRRKIGDQEFAKFEKISNELYEYQRKNLQELVDVGVLSKESYENIIAKNKKYIPFHRVLPEDLQLTQGGNKISSPQNPIKSIKGSDAQIVDPIESMIKNTYDIQATVEKQKVLQSMYSLAPNEFIPLKKGLSTKTPTIELWQDGKRMKFQTDQSIARALNSMDEENLNFAIKAMSIPAKTLRSGATSLNVAFALPNIIRDQLSAAVNSKYGGIPVYDFVNGLASVVKKDDIYKKWMLSGADQASFFAQDRTTLQRTVGSVTKNRGYQLGRLVKSPLELFRIAGELSEKGSRLGVFKRALKGASKEKGFSEQDILLAAMRESREATIDFAQRGSKMRAYNAIVPFLNARLQGSYKMIQSFKQRPIQTSAMGMAIAGAPAAALYVWNTSGENDKVYSEIPDYLKRENFILVTGNKETPFLKVPKGEVGKIFGNPVEAFLTYAKNEDGEWGKTAQTIVDSFLPVGSIQEPARFVTDTAPTAFTVPYQIIANYDAFRDQNIVSPFKKDLPAEYQDNKYTTETAKKIGRVLGISPAKLEFGISGYTGGLGRQALQMLDLAQGVDTPVQELPVVNRFAGTQKDLRNTADEIYKLAEQKRIDRTRENYRIKDELKKGNLSALDGLDKASASRLARSVKEDQIRDTLNPTEKALFDLSKTDLEGFVNDPELGETARKIIALKESLSPKRVASLKKKPTRTTKRGRKRTGRGRGGRRVAGLKTKQPRLRSIKLSAGKVPKISRTAKVKFRRYT